MHEEELIALSQRGDKESFQTLMERHRTTLTKTAYLATRDLEISKDVVQETLVQIWKGLPSYKPQGIFKAWLISILMNQARRRYRRKQLPTVEQAVAVNTPDEDGSPDDAAQQREQHEQIRSAIELLSDDHREVLVLRYFQNYRFPKLLSHLIASKGL